MTIFHWRDPNGQLMMCSKMRTCRICGEEFAFNPIVYRQDLESLKIIPTAVELPEPPPCGMVVDRCNKCTQHAAKPEDKRILAEHKQRIEESIQKLLLSVQTNKELDDTDREFLKSLNILDEKKKKSGSLRTEGFEFFLGKGRRGF